MVARSKIGAHESLENPLFQEQCWVLGDVKKHTSAPDGTTLGFWANRGCINRLTGHRIYLEVIFLPSGRATSAEAIKRFVRRLNSENPPQQSPPKRTKRQKAWKKKAPKKAT